MIEQADKPYAIEGKDGYFFLAGDSNDSVGQFTKPTCLSDETAQGWEKTLQSLEALTAERDITGCFLVAPAKEEIFPDKYPLNQAKGRLFDDFKARFGGRIFVPYWALRNTRNFSYCTGDTHWTDLGASMAAVAVLDQWGYDRDEAKKARPQDFRLVQRFGDLGIKAKPHFAHYEMMFSDDMAGRIIFNNGVRNQGNIAIYRNPDAAYAGRLLIFGDSFGTNMAAAFSSFFPEVVYTYRPAALDIGLVDLVQPTHLILEVTQRFLQGQPDLRSSIFDMARSKLNDLAPEERDKAIAAIAAQPEYRGIRAASLAAFE